MGNILTVILLTGWYVGYGQENWALQTEEDGISVYTHTFPDSRFKAIRAELELKASVSQMVAVLLDVNANAEWVYSTKSSILLRQVSPAELFYYSEVSVPWPFSNRDFIAHVKVSQDTVTRVVTVDGPTVADYLPEKKDIVRVARSEAIWVITPLGGGRIRVEYTLRMDPGGGIPAWVFNLFSTTGPIETFRKLKEQLKKPAYAQARLAFIVD